MIQKLIKLLVALCLVSALALKAEVQKFNIIIASNLPLINDPVNGDYRELATLLKRRTNNDTPSFFMFGGGSLGPSPMASFDKGAHIVDLLNWLEPDVMTLSKREFIYDEDELSLRAAEALFPFVSSNLLDRTIGRNLPGVSDFALLNKGGVKLGVLSVIDNELQDEYLLKRVQVMPIYESVKQQALILKDQGVQLILLTYTVSHPDVIRLLEDGIIDIAVSASHDLENTFKSGQVNHFELTTPGDVLELSIELNTDKRSFKASKTLLKLSNFGRDEEISKYTSNYQNRLDRMLNVRIGQFLNEVTTKREDVRSQENGFGNLIADAMRSVSGADIALINGGIIRGDRKYLPNSQLTKRDISIELPFRSKLEILVVTGRQLKSTLENAFSQYPKLKGRYPHISGFNVQFSSSRMPGNRVLSITYKGKEIEPTQTFRLATSDYLAQGGDGFAALKSANGLSAIRRNSPLISDVLITYIRKIKDLNITTDGRVINLEQKN